MYYKRIKADEINDLIKSETVNSLVTTDTVNEKVSSETINALLNSDRLKTLLNFDAVLNSKVSKFERTLFFGGAQSVDLSAFDQKLVFVTALKTSAPLTYVTTVIYSGTFADGHFGDNTSTIFKARRVQSTNSGTINSLAPPPTKTYLDVISGWEIQSVRGFL